MSPILLNSRLLNQGGRLSFLLSLALYLSWPALLVAEEPCDPFSDAKLLKALKEQAEVREKIAAEWVPENARVKWLQGLKHDFTLHCVTIASFAETWEFYADKLGLKKDPIAVEGQRSNTILAPDRYYEVNVAQSVGNTAQERIATFSSVSNKGDTVVIVLHGTEHGTAVAITLRAPLPRE